MVGGACTDLGVVQVGHKPVPEVRRRLAVPSVCVCVWRERGREGERAGGREGDIKLKYNSLQLCYTLT